MSKWRFTLFADEDDSSTTHDYGVVEAETMDEAFKKGASTFIKTRFWSRKWKASVQAAKFFGGRAKDYPTAFFTVSEVEANG